MLSRRTVTTTLVVLLACLARLAPALHGQSETPPAALAPMSVEAFADQPLPGEAVVTPEMLDVATHNPMLWQQYQALQAGGYTEEDCQACSGGASSYDRCGCNTSIFPWFRGPGNCDQWCIGPKWACEGSFLFWFREDADWDRVIADIGGAVTLEDQFDHGPGGRVFVTGYSDAGYGIQVGYEGINDWDSRLEFAPTPRAVAPLVDEFREITYQSRLNSVEINFLPAVPYAWKWYSGFRYVQLDEDYINGTRTDRSDPTAIVPPPQTPAGAIQFDNLSTNKLLENRLFGFQLGGRRDAWQFGNRLTLQTYANAGVYCNKLRRDDVDLTTTTTITGDDTATAPEIEFTETTTTSQITVRRDLTDIAFVGEAGLGATWRLNYCTAVSAGYQILALDGVGTALEASFTPGLVTDTLIFHGLQFGLEYRR